MKLHRYGERGLVTAWLESVRRDDGALVACLERATQVREKADIPRWPRAGEVDVYVEPSLSEFGNPDAVLLFGKRCAVFVEAKMCGFLDSGRTEAHDRNSSSLLHELYLKHAFCVHGRKATAGEPVKGLVYVGDRHGAARSSGTDAFVVKLVRRLLAVREVRYLAITNDVRDEMDRTAIRRRAWRVFTQNDVKRFEDFLDRLHVLTWSDIADVARAREMAEFLEAFDEN
ncbi:MAG: hypothetical protein FJ087_13160, partial [Deltaproteobacteria bacterium]|nr:hypothetical protein [Deltaproteobacteria bacterium]